MNVGEQEGTREPPTEGTTAGGSESEEDDVITKISGYRRRRDVETEMGSKRERRSAVFHARLIKCDD